MPRPRLYFEIFLVALAAILLEVNYTRVFSFKLVYFFTYVVIGLALLGLGSGGILVAMAGPSRPEVTPRRLVALTGIAAVSVVLSYLVIALVQVNAFDMIRPQGDAAGPPLREAAKLVLVSGALFVPFLCAGLMIATIFVADRERVGRLYCADLVGAGLGCAASVSLMQLISPPGCIILAGACFAFAGIRLARHAAPRFALPLAALSALLVVGAVSSRAWLPDPIVDAQKSMKPSEVRPVLFSRWSPVFRVDVIAGTVMQDGYMIAHDGMWGSLLPQFDGNVASLTRYDADARAIPFALLPSSPKVTIIGSAGGNEILASLYFGAEHVTAVELNPVTVSLLTTHFADYTGHVARHERVDLINAEGRAFFEGSAAKTDLVWFVAPDSYAAMNAATSGAYVLSESYLYTTEMIDAALAHLEPGGIICAQFGEIDYETKPNRTTRYLTTAREAMGRIGITDFDRHVFLATSRGFAFTLSTIVLRREPFTAADGERFAARAAATKGEVRYRGAAVASDHPALAAIVLAPDALRRWYASYAFDVRPVTDDAPFFWHFVPFRAALDSAATRKVSMGEEGLGERLLVALLVLVTVFAAVALLAPLAIRRTVWRTIPHKLAAGTYFACLGLGFMFFEVTLIQRLTLFLGYPTYSLTVTLFALLVASGIGSFASERLLGMRDRAVGGIGAALVVLAAFYLLGLGPILAQLGTAAFPVRIAIATVILVPLGLCLGTFMPLGLRTVAALSPHPDEYVAWAWAVNGFFSVVASVLATMLSMTFGFHAVMVLALCIYGVAIAALRHLPAPA
jgi:spermidine synthase